MRRSDRSPRPLARLAFGGLVLGALLLLAGPRALAATGATGTDRPAPGRAVALALTIVQVSDTALTLDSNSPATSGPHAQYVSYRITNTGATTATNLTATLSGFSGGIALAGSQSAALYVGSLAPGASATMYWFVTYPSTFSVRAVLTVTVTDGAGGTASGSGALRTLSMISAQAGGLTSSSVIGAGAVVGQLIPLDVTFTFKGWRADDTFNLQPAGNETFPAGCFQLVKDSIISADANLNAVIAPGTLNQTFFRASVASSGGGSSWNVVVRYVFRYLCAGSTATPLPYSNELSGGQLKYSANYGTGGGVPAPIPPAPSPSGSFTFTKTAASAQLPTGGTQTYTVAIRNTSTFDVTVDSIQDVLPAGVTYGGLTAASGVTAANSSATPAAGATGTIVFRGMPGSSYAIAAGATLNLVYTTTLSATAGQYVNTAGAYVGPTSIGSGSATVTVGTADLTVAKTAASSIAVSDTLVYTITVNNAGPATAYQVIARDTLPAGLTFLSASGSGAQSGGVVTWPTIASLAANARQVYTVTALAPASVTASVTNIAAASSASYDPAAANNNGSATTSRASTTVTLPVAVTPDGPATPIKRLQNGRYSQLFTVTSLAGYAASYDLLASRAGVTPFITIDSIAASDIPSHPRPDSARVTLAPRASAGYTVWYRVAAGDTAENVEVLKARSVSQPALLDTGWVNIRRTLPGIAITKSVSPAGVVVPGADLTYTTSFRNTGSSDAASVVLVDDVPTGVFFKRGSASSSLPSGITAVVEYWKDAASGWTYAPVAGGCGASAAYDGCVRRVRWTLSAALAPSPTASTVSFVGQVQ